VRVLLDEDIDVRLRQHFPEAVVVETVQYRGWKGLKNGELLRTAANEFDVLVTMDDNLPYQQNIPAYDLAVVVLRADSKALDDLLPLMPEVRLRLAELRTGDVLRVYPPPKNGA
jgi:predicted nuclease of predicted toxin-antitoxin system